MRAARCAVAGRGAASAIETAPSSPTSSEARKRLIVSGLSRRPRWKTSRSVCDLMPVRTLSASRLSPVRSDGEAATEYGDIGQILDLFIACVLNVRVNQRIGFFPDIFMIQDDQS